jgi:hypothetical protein
VAGGSPVSVGAPEARSASWAPRDRVLRLYQAAGVEPAWVGLGLLVGYMLLFLGVHNLTGVLSGLEPTSPDSPWGGRQLWWELVNGLLAGYLLTATAYAVRAARRDLRGLQEDFASAEAGSGAFADDAANVPPPWLHLGSVLGVVSGFLVATFDPGVWGPVGRPGMTDPAFLWALFRNVFIGWCGWRLAVIDLYLTRGFSRAAQRVAIDLLDPGRLAPFARKGQRSVLVWMGFAVLFSLFWLGDTPARSNSFLLVALVMAVTVLFLWPLWMLHRRLVAAKAEELERLNERIRRAVARVGPDTGSGPRLADWIAYRRLIEDVREWPINAPGVIRAALLMALAVGSWLGGAVVERLLGAALD